MSWQGLYDRDQIEHLFQFLAKARIALHLIQGRDHNRLTHPLQEQVAALLGFGKDPDSGSESLMKEYFLQARVLQRACLGTFQLGEGGEVVDLAEPPGSLRSVLQVFLDLKTGGVLSPRAAEQIRNSLGSVSKKDEFSKTGELIQAILTPHEKLYAILSQMYELGVLELLFPEFGTIKARVIRDFYHRYTVDEPHASGHQGSL